MRLLRNWQKFDDEILVAFLDGRDIDANQKKLL